MPTYPRVLQQARTVDPTATYAGLAEVRARDILALLSSADSGAGNAAAITTANTAAAAAGAAVVLPGGSYAVDPVTLAPRDGLRVVGAGARKDSGVGTLLTNTSTAGADALSVVGGNPASKFWSITLEDFSVAGNASSGHGVVLCSSGTTGAILGNVTVRRVSSYGHGKSGFKPQGRIDQLLFDETIARDNLNHGYELTVFNLLSECVLLGVHGSGNTDRGLYVGGTTFAVTAIGSEFSSNAIGVDHSSVFGGSVRNLAMFSCHFEHNSTYAAQAGSAASLGFTSFTDCNFLDNYPTPLDALVNLRFGHGALHFTRCTFSLAKDQSVGVRETAGSSNRVIYRDSGAGSSVGTGYLRQTRSGVKTNIPNGGPTADRWTVGNKIGDLYWDTDLGYEVRWDGTQWAATSISTYSPSGQILRSGWWHRPGAGTGTSATLGVGTLRLFPVFISKACTIDQIGLEVSTAGEAGSQVRPVIYADDATGGYPGALLADGGQIAADTTGAKTVTLGTPLVVAAGTTLWCGGVVQNVATIQPTLRTITIPAPLAPYSTGAPSGSALTLGFSQGGVTGGPPSTFSTSVSPSGQQPAFSFHLA